MTRVFATETFNASLDRAYLFCLFYLTQMNPNPESSGTGSISEEEVANQFQKGQVYVLTEWEYPNHFIVARNMGPAIVRSELSFAPTTSGVEVTWAFSSSSVGPVVRMFMAISRWRNAHAEGQDPEAHKSLLQLKHEVEYTDPGLEEAFLWFQAVLKGKNLSIDDLIKEKLLGNVQEILRCSAFFDVLSLSQPEEASFDNIAMRSRDALAAFAGLHLKAVHGMDAGEKEINKRLDSALEKLRQEYESGDDLSPLFPYSIAWQERISTFEKDMGEDYIREADQNSLKMVLLSLNPPTDADVNRIALQMSENSTKVVEQSFQLLSK